ncbi:hypothetical protein NL108_016886 [Boleophthalmus pectinirostris]|nr:hypothetical protein NL108_016886 [Boleophthalmus pectinirostris]
MVSVVTEVQALSLHPVTSREVAWRTPPVIMKLCSPSSLPASQSQVAHSKLSAARLLFSAEYFTIYSETAAVSTGGMRSRVSCLISMERHRGTHCKSACF